MEKLPSMHCMSPTTIKQQCAFQVLSNSNESPNNSTNIRLYYVQE